MCVQVNVVRNVHCVSEKKRIPSYEDDEGTISGLGLGDVFAKKGDRFTVMASMGCSLGTQGSDQGDAD